MWSMGSGKQFNLDGHLDASDSGVSLDSSYLHCDGTSSHGDFYMKSYMMMHCNVQTESYTADFWKNIFSHPWVPGHGTGVCVRVKGAQLPCANLLIASIICFGDIIIRVPLAQIFLVFSCFLKVRCDSTSVM